MDVDYSAEAVTWAAELVRAYTDSVDGNIGGKIVTILNEVGRNEAELRNLVASLAGVAGHAVMVIAAQIDALTVEDDPERRMARLEEQRTEVLAECARAVRAFRPAIVHFPAVTGAGESRVLRERRSGFDRRLGSDRRQRTRGNPSERINLQLYGERRVGVADRRSGIDRRAADGGAG